MAEPVCQRNEVSSALEPSTAAGETRVVPLGMLRDASEISQSLQQQQLLAVDMMQSKHTMWDQF